MRFSSFSGAGAADKAIWHTVRLLRPTRELCGMRPSDKHGPILDDIVETGAAPTARDTLFYRLYSDDGSHPSVLGTQLTAYVFFAAVTGQNPVDLPRPAECGRMQLHCRRLRGPWCLMIPTPSRSMGGRRGRGHEWERC